MVEHLDERLQRVAEVAGVGAGKDDGAVFVTSRGQLTRQTCLAGARFATDEYRPATTGDDLIPVYGELAALLAATDKRGLVPDPELWRKLRAILRHSATIRAYS